MLYTVCAYTVVGLSILVSSVVTKKNEAAAKKEQRQTHNHLAVCRSLSTSSLGISGTSANEASAVSHRRMNQLGGGAGESSGAAAHTGIRKERSGSSSNSKVTPNAKKLRTFSYGLPLVQEKKSSSSSNSKQPVNNSLSASAALSPASVSVTAKELSAVSERKSTSVKLQEESGGRKPAHKSVGATTVSTNVDESMSSVWTRDEATQYSPERSVEPLCKATVTSCQSHYGMNNNTSTFGNGALTSGREEPAACAGEVLTNYRAFEAYNQVAMYATPTHLRYSAQPIAVSIPSVQNPGDQHLPHNHQHRPILQQRLSYPPPTLAEFGRCEQMAQPISDACANQCACTCPKYSVLAASNTVDLVPNLNANFDFNSRGRSMSESIVEATMNAEQGSGGSEESEPVWQYAHALQCTCGLGPNYSLPSAAALLPTVPTAILTTLVPNPQRSSDIF